MQNALNATNPGRPRQLLARGEVLQDDGTFYLALVWTENSQIYLTNLNRSSLKFEATDAQLAELEGKLIPTEDVYPPWRHDITEAPTPLPPDTYTKMPYWHCIEGKTDFELMYSEIDHLEMLSKERHPNIVEYLGCIREGDYIKGICLRRYPCTLQELVKGEVPADQRPPFDAEKVISGMRTGLDFLHSLGLVHDDIKPRNIMLQSDGRAVIIDFDSCSAVGTKSRGGTPGWSRNPPTAQFENDEHGLELVVKFIKGEYDGQDLSPFGM